MGDRTRQVSHWFSRCRSVLSIGLLTLISYSPLALTAQEAPYGMWLLLNPEVLGKKVTAGALIICSGNASSDSDCGEKNHFTLVFLEDNGTYGCTDFVSKGSAKKEAEKPWQLFARDDDDEEKETLLANIERSGEHLILTDQEQRHSLKFKKDTYKNIEKIIDDICSQKYKEQKPH
ncbi:hypothetical protein [Endozoicomonas sp. 8E]|uniref:hypothetical protein n=1 Tax=Endozoicomonas sp. 8E TaxID=3035692 RepID=UPI00293900F2|nr:hypothetical protein [Endozoicomonas sp. 8E]WOG27588.1 hypothetical protein P6910_24080 [Endozoicomonas sp. 8E]